jgi:threonine dehydratase
LLANGLKVTPKEKVCVVLTGGNWDLCDLAKVFRRGN